MKKKTKKIKEANKKVSKRSVTKEQEKPQTQDLFKTAEQTQDVVLPSSKLSSGFAYRFVVIGDPHLRRTDPLGIIEEDGINSRLKDKLQAIRGAVAYAVNESATHIVFLGDIFDAINPPEWLKKAFWSALVPAIEQNIQIRIIIGNHDTTGRVYNFAGDQIIKPQNVQIVDNKPFSETLSLSSRIKPLTVKYIPYERKEKLLKWINAEKTNILFGHLEIEGAELAPDNTTIRQGIDRSLLKGDLIWLGHIHKFQEFSPGFGYIGSCVRCDFGEINNRKVFGVANISPNGEIACEYIDIEQRPMYHVTILENDPDNLYLANKLPEQLLQKGVLIKFTFAGSNEWIRAIDKQRFKNRFKNAIRIVIKDEKIDTDRKKTDDVVTSNMEDRIHAYIRSKDKGKEYLSVGLEIEKVSSAGSLT